MIVYSLKPEFGCSYMYGEFYQRVGGQHWFDLQKAIANLKEALKDREFLLSLIHFRDHETKDETFEIEVMPGMIVIKMECLTREIIYNKVNKTVTVDGKEYSRTDSVREETEWRRQLGSWGCFVSKLETSDEPC